MTDVLAHEVMTLGTDTPRLGIDWTKQPNRYLAVDGVPAYQIAYSCGTCGLVLRRQPGAPDGCLSVDEVRARLTTGLRALDGEVVAAFSAQLPRGDYLVMLLDVRPRLVAPGSAEDYFATDGPAAWQNEEFEYNVDPTNISYYRLGQGRVGEHDELFQFAVPMFDAERLAPERVAQYAAADDGRHLTAVALGLLDIEGPWFRRERHAGLFHFLLDGHHKMAAAATIGRPIRLLTFVSSGDSFAGDEDLLNLPANLTTIGNSARQE
jgi:hypothetical protein